MTITKRTVNINSKNRYVSILLENKKNKIGDDQSIDTLADNNSINVINPVNDVESYKFKLNSTGTTIQFKFNNVTTDTNFALAYGYTGMTNNVVANSYIIMDIYDNTDIQKQTRLNRNYFTQLNPNNVYVNVTGLTSIYILNKLTPIQLNYILIPKKYLDSTSEDSLFCRFMFYDALNGRIINFVNQSKITLATNDKLFFEIKFNKNLRTWVFVDTVIIPYGEVLNTYSDKISDAMLTQVNKTENYPAGNVFNYNKIDYDVIQ